MDGSTLDQLTGFLNRYRSFTDRLNAARLERFRSGVYLRIVTSQVLDEGVDVPDASLAVVLSGTGSSRQFIQRLGRVLRKGEGKQAKLLELVSKGTAETRVSRRRRSR